MGGKDLTVPFNLMIFPLTPVPHEHSENESDEDEECGSALFRNNALPEGMGATAGCCLSPAGYMSGRDDK